jgi:hypothetical protein
MVLTDLPTKVVENFLAKSVRVFILSLHDVVIVLKWSLLSGVSAGSLSIIPTAGKNILFRQGSSLIRRCNSWHDGNQMMSFRGKRMYSSLQV